MRFRRQLFVEHLVPTILFALTLLCAKLAAGVNIPPLQWILTGIAILSLIVGGIVLHRQIAKAEVVEISKPPLPERTFLVSRFHWDSEVDQ